MNRFNIEIDSLILTLDKTRESLRTEEIANNTMHILEKLLQNHSFNIAQASTRIHVDKLKIPTISINEWESEMDISRNIAFEIYRALLEEGGL